MIRALLLLALLAAAAAPAAAQQRPPAQRPDTLSPQQRALLRLRNLPAPARPDTVTTATDSIPAQQVQVTGAAARPAPSQIQRDSIMDQLLRIGTYIGTEYSADSARYDAGSRVLELRGQPQVAREGNQLVADSSIVYDEARALACGYGSPVLHAAGQPEPLASDTVCFDVERQVGQAIGASTRVQEGATWNVRCDAYFLEDQLYCHDALFSDCDLPYPHQHYAFGAKELKVVRNNVMVGRNVTMRFADVPVFWLPFMVQSLSRGRRSGILMPRFGINDIARNSSSYNRRIEDVGFYWAINDYMGAELAMDWFSDNWTSLRGSFDYNWARQFLRGGLTYRHFWREGGGSNFTLASSNSWQPDERTSLSLSANFAQAEFVRRRSFDPNELNQSIQSNGGINRRFDWGTINLTLSRRQQLSDNTVAMTLPNVSLNFLPLTLFEAMPGEERWYSNLTWNGGASLNRATATVGAANTNPQALSRQDLTGRVNSSIRLGRLGWSQNFDFQENTRESRTLPGDSVALPGFSEQRGSWSTSLSFQQRLIGTSTLTPGVSIRGDYVRNDSTGQSIVSGPMRVDFSSALRTDLFGFWPGFGPFQRFRHRLSPSFTYSYSPAARADSLQRAIFGGTGVAEQNRITIGLTQTFEAKYRDEPESERAAPRDTAAVGDTAQADTALATRRTAAAGDTLGGVVLQRREQVRTVSLLAINTQAIVYDFVQARDGYGLVTTTLNNSVQSELLRGMQLSFTHDLFRTSTDSLGVQERSFAPHLSQVNASFSLNANSWLFRVLGLGRRDTVSTQQGGAALEQGEQDQAGPAVDRTESEYGLIGTGRRTAPGSPRGAVGTWNASFNYSLVRPRSTIPGVTSNQMLTANVTFQPTENWTVRWNTGYSFTDSEFANHVLTLTRRLHDWDANFDFVKAQNGNFSFMFRVHLRANPDVKLDYSQSEVRGLQGR
ncbi:MAG TPA: putative LPS assembly protein LptD [Longimicrobiales bacterium]